MAKDDQQRNATTPDGPSPSSPTPAAQWWAQSVWTARLLLALGFVVAGLFWTSGILSHTFLQCTVPGTGIFLLGLALAGLLRWRASRAWRGVGLAAWVGVVAVLVLIYVFAWQPLRTKNLWHNLPVGERGLPEPDAAEVRSVCHKLLVWADPYAVSGYLDVAGDETSVPYLLWAIRWTDRDTCSYQHAMEALQTITNNSPGLTPEAWPEWYAKNRRRSQMTWWADGFVAEGYKAFPYEDKEAPKAARELLAVLGRPTWMEPPGKWYLTFNAVRMLKKLPAADVRKAMGESVKGESPAEKRGLTHYTEHLSRTEGEPMLKAMAADTDRSVRLAATGQICGSLIERWPAKETDAAWRLCNSEQVPPEVLAEAAARPAAPAVTSPATGPGATAPATAPTPAVVSPRAGRSANVRGPADVPKAIRDTFTPPPGTIAAGTHGKAIWLLRVEGLKDQAADPNGGRDEPYVLHVEGWSPQTGRKLYSRQLANSRTGQADSVCWLSDAAAGRLYVSIPTYTAAIDVATGAVAWEAGFGGAGANDLLALEPFLVVVRCGTGYILFGAAGGEIVASCGSRDASLDPARLRLFNGRAWTHTSDGHWYVLDFSTTHPPWSEPAEVEPLDSSPGTGH